MEMGLVLGVSHGPVKKGLSHSPPQFWGFSSICDYTL